MDCEQRLIPAGVLGEPGGTRDRLSRGYPDHMANKERFIHVSNREGQLILAYRTGDFIRRHPVDGKPEFIGRLRARRTVGRRTSRTVQ